MGSQRQPQEERSVRYPRRFLAAPLQQKRGCLSKKGRTLSHSAFSMQLSPEKRIAGILAPLFALRSETDLGIGDTDCLRQLVDWAAEAGFHLVQLLPINETGADNSPYMAISSVALEPGTLAISPDTIPDLTRETYREVLAGYDLDKLRAGPVLYAIVKSLKLL